MSVSALGDARIPPAAAAWIDGVLLVFAGLLVLWVVLKAVDFFVRKSYNLTPVATAGSRDVRPDFLKVDRDAQERMVERGREFDQPPAPALAGATRFAGAGVVLSGLVSLVSAAFLALGRIEEMDATWRDLSVQDRFVTIVWSHPVGFGIALSMIVAALVRVAMSFRAAK